MCPDFDSGEAGLQFYQRVSFLVCGLQFWPPVGPSAKGADKMMRHAFAVALAIAIALCCSVICRADVVSVISSPSIGFSTNPLDLVDSLGNACFGACAAGVSLNHAAIIGYGSSGGQDATSLTYTATSQAQYGLLRAYTTGTQTGQVNSPGGFVDVRSTFTDDLTISGGTGNGTAVFTFNVDGIATDNGAAGGGPFADSQLEYYFGLDSAYSESVQTLVDVTNTDFARSIVVTVPIQFGQTFLFRGEILASLFLGCQTGGSTPCTAYTASGTTDFSSTAELTGIQVFDSNNNPLNNAQISSSSGTVYPDAVVVPEPASVISLASVAAILLGALRRRSRSLDITHFRS